MKIVLAILFTLLSLAPARALNFSVYSNTVNVKDYGAVCNGSTDDVVAIQAAIDDAYARQIAQVYIPGTCKFTPPLFLDPPGNLRGNAAAYAAGTTYAANNTVTYQGKPWISLQGSNTGNTPALGSAFWGPTTATPTNFNFSMCLVGQQQQGNDNGFGSNLIASSNATVALWIGTGQGMCVKNLSVRGPSIAYRGAQNPAGVGIAIAGGSGGASKTLLENLIVANFYACYQTGSNQDSLAEDNTFVKAVSDNCYIGMDFKQTQNDVNLVIDTQSTSTINVRNQTSRPVHFIGGSFGSGSGLSASNSISSISSVTSGTCPEYSAICYSFSATVASPDAHWADGVYNSFSIVTTSFGVIPLIMTSWNAGTGVATFHTWYNRGQFYLRNITALSATDLQTEIQAATTVYAAERITVFAGTGFTTYGMWIEQGGACTTLVDQVSAFTGDNRILLERAIFHYDIAYTSYGPNAGGSPTGAQQSIYYCQQSFPFILQEPNNSAGSIALKHIDTGQYGNTGGGGTTDPVVFDVAGNTPSRLIVQDCDFFSPNVRTTGAAVSGSYPPISGSGVLNQTLAQGAGEWDVTPFLPRASAALLTQNFYPVYGTLKVPYQGFSPAHWATPRAIASILTAWGSPGTLGTYPLMSGNTIYSVVDWNSGTLTKLFARSAHKFFSYGQDLTTSNVSGLSWSYKGQSFVVNLDALSVQWVFPGLGLTLDNGGGAVNYIVTGVYPGLRYMTVFNLTSDAYSAANLLAGTKTVTYTGSTIGQEAYSITQY